MTQFVELKVKKRGKNHRVTAKFITTETGKHGLWTPTWTKESNQFLSKDLDNCISKMIPHILFGGEYISEEISLDAELNYPKWFEEHLYLDDQRFTGVEITKIQFYGKDAVDSIKIWGYKETQRTEKAFKAPLETPVIHLSKEVAGYYPLVTILDEQVTNLIAALDGWLTKGETLSKSEQASLFEQYEHQEA
jgi:hypothetical protein